MFFRQWAVLDPGNLNFIHFRFNSEHIGPDIGLNEILPTVLVWFYIRLVVSFSIILIIIKKLLLILRSVKNRKTFHTNNAIYFNQLALLWLILALFNLVVLGQTGDSQILNLNLPIPFLILSLSCKVLSEIFMEGGRIEEDSNSII